MMMMSLRGSRLLVAIACTLFALWASAALAQDPATEPAATPDEDVPELVIDYPEPTKEEVEAEEDDGGTVAKAEEAAKSAAATRAASRARVPVAAQVPVPVPAPAPVIPDPAPVEQAPLPTPGPAPTPPAARPEPKKSPEPKKAAPAPKPEPVKPSPAPTAKPAPAPKPAAAAPNDSTRLEDLPRYDARDEPGKTITNTVAALVLLQLAAGGAMAAAGAGAAAGATREEKKGTLKSAKVRELKLHAQGLAAGDGSRTWRWPGTAFVDAASRSVPAWLGLRSALLGRVTADGSYLRAMLGSAYMLIPLAALALGGYAVADVQGDAMPPALTLMIAIGLLGVLDATAGLLAVLVFVVGVAALGGVDSWPALRTLLALAGMWVTVPILAGYARPLRRDTPVDKGELYDRFADIAVAGLLAAWTVQSVVKFLPALSGYQLPVADHANTIALVILGGMALRIAFESLATAFFPERLGTVHSNVPACPGKIQVAGVAVRGAIFVLVAIEIVGSSWQLWVGTVMFLIPFFLRIYEDDWFTENPKVARFIPDGLLKSTLMLFLLSLWAGVLLDLFQKDSPDYIANIFVLVAVPGFVLSLVGSVFGKHRNPSNWITRFAGIPLLILCVLQVQGPLV